MRAVYQRAARQACRRPRASLEIFWSLYPTRQSNTAPRVVMTIGCRSLPVVRAILRASAIMLGKPAGTHSSPSAFDQVYLNHAGIVTANFGAGEHQYARTDCDMASVECTADSAKVYAFAEVAQIIGKCPKMPMHALS
jgi:hypothetical protein